VSESSEKTEDSIEALARAQEAIWQTSADAGLTDKLTGADTWLDNLVRRSRHPDEKLARAADWILDNEYRIRRAIRMVRRDLPTTTVSSLPAFAPEQFAADASGTDDTPGSVSADLTSTCVRAHEVACRLLIDCDLRVEKQALLDWLLRYQAITPLDEAELWALPAMARLICLRRLMLAVADLTDLPAPLIAMQRTVEQYGDPDAEVGDVVAALVALDEIDWSEFVASASCVERVLGTEAAAIYESMSPDTRAHYRRAVERFAAQTRSSELDVAERVVACTYEHRHDPLLGHAGYWLIGDGSESLAASLGLHERYSARVSVWLQQHLHSLYAIGLFAVTLAALTIPVAYLRLVGASPYQYLLVLALASMPASVIAVGLVNWIATHWRSPCRLPSLDPRRGIPAGSDTLVAIPVIVHAVEEVVALIERLEIRHLANPDARLSFVLLSDLADAPAESMSTDQAIERALVDGIESLAERYADAGPSRFVLLHRARRFNPAENLWMGRERKRGKLEELDALIVDGWLEPFALRIGDMAALRRTRYVITLDADTTLPPDSAARLVCTLAHPLNRACIDSVTGRVSSGYTVLQPRVETLALRRTATSFAHVYAGDGAIDIYSRAVSDVYQDLFGQGSFVGKGIYEVRTFRAALEGRVPENCILSHDLFEGLHSRVALASEIVLYESYPGSWIEHAQRQHRWIRGDWQLLPWLGGTVPAASGTRLPSRFTGLDRWKLLDNLRRSIVPPMLLGWFLAGWFLFPGSAIVWTLLGIGAFAPYLLDESLSGLARVARRRSSRGAGHRLGARLMRSGFALVFLVGDSRIALDAIIRALWRSFASGRRMLEWMPAEHTRQNGIRNGTKRSTWRLLWPSPVLAIATGAALFVIDPRSLLVAIPLLVAWLLAPLVALLSARPRTVRRDTLRSVDRAYLRKIARRTWHFYDTFAGPDDHWLPPDNYQSRPVMRLARRTSPTNIGLYLASTVVARDIGFIATPEFEARARHVLDSVDRLTLHRGHLLNWYDTATLAPLEPHYVSTVDSGNLAICLIALIEACRDFRQRPPVEHSAIDGIIDTTQLLRETYRPPAATDDDIRDYACETLSDVTRSAFDEFENELAQLAMRTADLSGREWRTRLERALLHHWFTLERAIIADDVDDSAGSSEIDEQLVERRVWLERVDHQLRATMRDLDALCPWLVVLDDAPPERKKVAAAIDSLWTPSLAPDLAAMRAEEYLVSLGKGSAARGSATTKDAENRWDQRLRDALTSGLQRNKALFDALESVASRAHACYRDMDFAWLYDDTRRLLRIGYDVSAGRPDPNHYDLLASEARIASFVAIARRDVPVAHWFALGRPLVRPAGHPTAQSWSGSMFEYLMPPLFLPAARDTLLGDSESQAVLVQQASATANGIPWGTSESAFGATDVDGNYQYQAFGCDDLGIRRGLERDRVVAPYASLLALGAWPRASVDNLRHLDRLGALGLYGFIDALDYTASRRPPDAPFARVETWMAHHHGMSLIAILDALSDDAMAQRVLREPTFSAIELLLHERVPWDAPSERPRVPIGVAGNGDDTPAREAGSVWVPPRSSPAHPIQLLGNGRLSARLRRDGGSTLFHDGIALTRWSNDTALEYRGGYRLHVRDEPSSVGWWLGMQPDGLPPPDVVFAGHEVDTVQHVPGMTLRLESAIAAYENTDIRRVSLVNESAQARVVRVTSHAEVALARPEEDERHPAFARMFIESRNETLHHGLSFRRRPREPGATTYCLLHRVVLDTDAALVGIESDRRHWLGRGGVPNDSPALGQMLSGETGYTLDPVMALDVRVEIPPGETRRIAFLTLVDTTREAVLERSSRLTLPRVERLLVESRNAFFRELHRRELDGGILPLQQRLASLLLDPQSALRTVSDSVDEPGCRQDELWSYGLSGDLPILLLRMDERSPVALLETLVGALGFWRQRGFLIDLVVLRIGEAGYDEPLRERVMRVLRESDSLGQLGRDGGVHLISLSPAATRARTALEDAASLVLETDSDLDTSLGLAREFTSLPPLLQASEPRDRAEVSPLPSIDDLQFDNGLGGFAADGESYVMQLEPGECTPAPWCNVLANESFGAIVSESGLGFTWADNSGERRLSRWSGDPIADTPGELLWLRDEATTEYWCVPPMAPYNDAPVQVRHALGHTRWQRHDHGLEQTQLVVVPPDAPVRLVRLRLHNPGERIRRLTATYFVDWLLGALPSQARRHVRAGYDARANAIFARNDWNADFAGRIAFLSASQAAHSVSGDRAAFIGEGGDLRRPAALARTDLGGRFVPGGDACGAWQVHLDLAPGEHRDIVFVVGEGATRSEAEALVAHWREPARIDTALSELSDRWDTLCGAVKVRTPDAAFDLLINRWLVYQCVSSRLLARAGFYQASGAFGFRDQLQDSLALLPADPGFARRRILDAATRQFEEGDVLHWWHPPLGRGIRTRCSDDRLWLAYATFRYIKRTGDMAILDIELPFLSAPELEDDEEDRYAVFAQGSVGTLLEHCARAVECGMRTGAHGLPFIGTGDWNDGMDGIGRRGLGESVWLAWFRIVVVRGLAPLAEGRGAADRAGHWREHAQALERAIHANAWDGDWFLRAFDDDAEAWGSSASEECKIDALAQAWSALADCSDASRVRQALASADHHLVDRQARLVRLLTPPFHDTQREPGYIKSYPPGIRENGGQYTHAAAWLGLAWSRLGEGDRAYEIFDLIGPIRRSATRAGAEHYRTEPYVLAADIGGGGRHEGVGGWTWYTGAASWVWQLGVSGILGIEHVLGGIRVSPQLPAAWLVVEVMLHSEEGSIALRMEQFVSETSSVAQLTIDEKVSDDDFIPFPETGTTRRAVIRIGRPSADLTAVNMGVRRARDVRQTG